MKKNVLFFAIVLTSLFSLPVFSQTNDEPVALGLPGDNLNLFAVLDVFQKSKTLEEFEKELNDQNTKINNLDLNNDGEVDYIEVESYKEGETHVIVLKDALNSKETQDVAVIEVVKDKNKNVHVQAIGDEDLYGKNYIVEPVDTFAGTPNPGYKGNSSAFVNANSITYDAPIPSSSSYISVNINTWPIILYLFSPLYVVYHSPWHWGFYPPYWRPWRPVFYNIYWGYHGHFYRNPHYRRTAVIRYPHHYDNYFNRRNTSAIVRTNRDNGRYNTTYNGQDYKRPTPVTPTRPSSSGITTRPNTTTRPPNSTTPATRPNTTTRPSPSTRPAVPSTTRPSTSNPATRPVTPSTRPSTAPTTRPSVPATRPVSPSSLPSRPAVRPAPSTARPVTPITRPAQPVTRPAAPRAGR